jgi:predicted NUDIX family NTP pyrophosphohydrolase
MTASKSHKRIVSAGLLVWRRSSEREYLLAHPGGPYWAKKDDGAWTIPKGLVEPSHDLEATAKREFLEETGISVSGDLVALNPVKAAGGKIVHAFAVEADLKLDAFASNAFTIEWPPRSGRNVSFPEIDRISYFGYADALLKIISYQRPLIEQAHDRFK